MFFQVTGIQEGCIQLLDKQRMVLSCVDEAAIGNVVFHAGAGNLINAGAEWYAAFIKVECFAAGIEHEW